MLDKLFDRFYRRLGVWRLSRRYRYLRQVNSILEEYQTNKILEGGSEEFKAAARKQLIDLQKDSSEYNHLISFLSKI